MSDEQKPTQYEPEVREQTIPLRNVAEAEQLFTFLAQHEVDQVVLVPGQGWVYLRRRAMAAPVKKEASKVVQFKRPGKHDESDAPSAGGGRSAERPDAPMPVSDREGEENEAGPDDEAPDPIAT